MKIVRKENAMRKIIIALVLTGMIIGFTGCGTSGTTERVTDTPIALPVDAQGSLVTNSSLRSGPGSSFDEIGQLPKGKNIHIIGTSTDIEWYLIIYEDSQGISIRAWVPVESVELDITISGYPTDGEETIKPVTTLTFTSTVLAQISTVTGTGTSTRSPTLTPTLRPISTTTFTSTAAPVFTARVQHEPTGNENILIVFDNTSATLINISLNYISVTGIEFRRIDSRGNVTASFNSDGWTNVTSKTNALPPNDCLIINTQKSSRPVICSSAWGFITSSHPEFYFWIEGNDSQQFQVWQYNILLQTCKISAGSCKFFLPQQ